FCALAWQSCAWAWLTWQVEIRAMPGRDRVTLGRDKAELNHTD
ncbi:hypothetical protein A2U01_0091869, partial [Trifolium medium]|nr:hypothetical protein [Trifolium medium]